VRREVRERRLRPAPGARWFEPSRVRSASGRGAWHPEGLQLSSSGGEHLRGGPVLLGGVAAGTPIPGRGGCSSRSQLGLLPVLPRLVTKGSLKVFPECLRSPWCCPGGCWGLPRAVPGPSGVIPVGCANGRCTHGSTCNAWPRFLSSPSRFLLFSSWPVAEN